MPSTASSRTTEELRKLFAAYGLPEQLVSDNGPQFVAEEFGVFLKSQGVKHIRCSPYHPSSNGAAERFIQCFKQAMKAGAGSTPPLSQRLSNFLLTYRATPHATTNTPPCELFLGRRVRTRFDLLHPSCGRTVSDKQAAQKASHDQHARHRELEVDQNVMVRNWRPGPEWVPGVVTERLGPRTYRIRTRSSQFWKRPIDHVRELGKNSEERTEAPKMTEDDDFDIPPSVHTPEPILESLPPPTTESGPNRYPQRNRRAPNRFV